jgi:hypothetical protein
MVRGSPCAMMGRLSVFPAWFEMTDAIRLGIRFGMAATAVSACVSILVTKSIVMANISAEGTRYRSGDSACLRLHEAG